MKSQLISSQVLSILLALLVLFSSCTSSTVIVSNPPGAKVYINGEAMGTTPYKHSDTNIVGTDTDVRLEKEGYQTLHVSFSRNERVDVGALIGGLFVWVPFLWIMKYNPMHKYELVPATESSAAPTSINTNVKGNKSKADRLRELKGLLDDKIITPEEYEKEKKKILDENNR